MEAAVAVWGWAVGLEEGKGALVWWVVPSVWVEAVGGAVVGEQGGRPGGRKGGFFKAVPGRFYAFCF